MFLTSEFRTRRYAFTFDPDQLSVPFEKPVLILTGRQDGIAGYQDTWQLLANYPKAAYAVLDRAGHMLHLEQEQAVKSLIEDWLEQMRTEHRNR